MAAYETFPSFKQLPSIIGKVLRSPQELVSKRSVYYRFIDFFESNQGGNSDFPNGDPEMQRFSTSSSKNC
jgi:hypothetical protein